MDIARQLRQIADASFCDAQRKREERMRVFLDPLHDWVNDLAQRKLPVNWRERLGRFLAAWEPLGFEFRPSSRQQLEAWIESWGRFRGMMPAAEEIVAAAAQTASAAIRPTPAVSIQPQLPPLEVGRLELAGTGPETTQSFRDKVQAALEVLDVQVAEWWGVPSGGGLVRPSDANTWRYGGQIKYYSMLDNNRPILFVDQSFTAGQTAEKIVSETRSGLFAAAMGMHYQRHEFAPGDAPRELKRWLELRFTEPTGYASVLAELVASASPESGPSGEAVVRLTGAAKNELSWQQFLRVLPLLSHVFKGSQAITVNVGGHTLMLPMSVSRDLAKMGTTQRTAVMARAVKAATLEQALAIINAGVSVGGQSQSGGGNSNIFRPVQYSASTSWVRSKHFDIWWAVDEALGVIEVPATFITGGGDSFSLGLTSVIRNWLWGEELSQIRHKGAYQAGEWTEVGIEVVVTGGGALMKRAAAKKIAKEAAEIAARSVGSVTKEAAEAAAKVAEKRVANSLRTEARALLGANKDEIVHHINTLLGHPPYPGRGSVPSEFPTLGIEWLANSKWNLTTITRNQPGKHIWLHQRAYIAEQMVIKATHPVLTGARAISNLARDGRVEITVTIDCRK